MKVYFDFETRSAIDLKAHGAYVYAAHESTDIVCLAWAVNDGPVKIYRPLDGDAPPMELLALVINPVAEFYAHNANFERLIWHFVCAGKYGWPLLDINKLYCTMGMAYNLGLMGSLDAASKAVGLSVEKDMKGHRVMLQLSQPRSIDDYGNITWWERRDSKSNMDINAKYDMTYRYCMQDIVVLRELEKRLLPLDSMERRTWILDQKINDRGVHIDIISVNAAMAIADIEKQECNEKIKSITEGYVGTVNSHIAFKKWVTDNGVLTESLDKSHTEEILERENIPPHVREALEIKQIASKSSTSKLKRMKALRNSNGRACGNFQYYGAFSTGRFAGRGIQLQNMPRPSITQEKIEELLELMSGVNL